MNDTAGDISTEEFSDVSQDKEELIIKKENEKIEQSKIIVTSVEFPSAVSSITCDGLNMNLVACAMDGRFKILYN